MLEVDGKNAYLKRRFVKNIQEGVTMKKDCVYEGKCFAHGSPLDIPGETLVCSDGRWVKELDQPSPTVAPGEDLSDI
jgi:hypothetical protein